MKDQILKIAGVKNEADFYRKYPTEEAFFKAHPQAKKMVNGGKTTNQDRGQLKKLDQLLDFGNPPMAESGILAPISNTVNAAQPFQSKFTQLTLPKNLPSVGGMSKGLGGAAGYIQPAMDLIEGFSMIGDQNRELREAEQNAKLTEVQAQAAALRPQPINRRYVRPEDALMQPEQMFPTYGVGTNILAAEDGATIGGNPGEIQNTYAPIDLYEDLGYEPLSDSDKLKSYQLGGDIGSGGFGDFMNSGGNQLLNNLTSLTQSRRGPSAGNQIGKGIGSAAGTALFGPGGGMVGGALGNVVGGLFDNTGEKLDAFKSQTGSNMNSVMGQKFGRGFQQQFGLKDGGYVSNDWTPQLITKFGEYDVKDLLKPPHDADMLRAGGHLKKYTPPSERAMYTGRAEDGAQMAMGGDLKVYRGEAESISNNPYLPDGGETIMFRGPSHDNGGMPISFGQSPVEVEGGEPAVKLKDGGTGEDNLVVFGNLQIPNQFLSEIGDPKAKGKKFKNYTFDLSKIEARQNKIIEKSTNQLNELDPESPFDKLTLGALNANIMGANMKLKDIATKKQNAAAVQSAINDTAEEYGLIADDLAKGKIKIDRSKGNTAKYGTSLPKAQAGDEYGLTPWTGNKSKGSKYGKKTASSFSLDEWNKVAQNLGFKGKGNKEFQEFLLNDPRSAELIKARHKELYGTEPVVDEKLGYGYAAKELLKPMLKEIPRTPLPRINDITIKKPYPTVGGTASAEAKGEDFPWMQVANQLIPYLRPSDAEQLDPNQLMGEMFALSQNQEEDPEAQTYQPQLSTPQDISFQDALNANQADFNAVLRQSGYNPEAQASLAAQKYAANQKILAEEFRVNQGEKQRVYEGNRNVLNDAQLKNLQIFDQQYGRQATARSNTKATTQAALNSISSKIAQNRLDNRTLATMENLYNYRFDPSFRARNMNPLVDFDSMLANASPEDLTSLTKKIEEKTKKSGTAKKDSRNGSIVKAIKNL